MNPLGKRSSPYPFPPSKHIISQKDALIRTFNTHGLEKHLSYLNIDSDKINGFISQIAKAAIIYLNDSQIFYFRKHIDCAASLFCTRPTGEKTQSFALNIIYPNKPGASVDEKNNSLLGIGGYKKVKKGVTIVLSDDLNTCRIERAAIFSFKRPYAEKDRQERHFHTIRGFLNRVDSLRYILQDIPQIHLTSPVIYIDSKPKATGTKASHSTPRILGSEKLFDCDLGQANKLNFYEMCTLLEEICVGCSQLDDKGLAHADLSFNNILLENTQKGYKPKITDLDTISFVDFRLKHKDEAYRDYYLVDMLAKVGIITPFVDVRSLVVGLALGAHSPILDLHLSSFLTSLKNDETRLISLKKIVIEFMRTYANYFEESELNAYITTINDQSTYFNVKIVCDLIFIEKLKDENQEKRNGFSTLYNFLYFKVAVFDLLLLTLDQERQLYSYVLKTLAQNDKRDPTFLKSLDQTGFCLNLWENIKASFPQLLNAEKLSHILGILKVLVQQNH